jgi:hypothetical protein
MARRVAVLAACFFLALPCMGATDPCAATQFSTITGSISTRYDSGGFLLHPDLQNVLPVRTVPSRRPPPEAPAFTPLHTLTLAPCHTWPTSRSCLAHATQGAMGHRSTIAIGACSSISAAPTARAAPPPAQRQMCLPATNLPFPTALTTPWLHLAPSSPLVRRLPMHAPHAKGTLQPPILHPEQPVDFPPPQFNACCPPCLQTA